MYTWLCYTDLQRKDKARAVWRDCVNRDRDKERKRKGQIKTKSTQTEVKDKHKERWA